MLLAAPEPAGGTKLRPNPCFGPNRRTSLAPDFGRSRATFGIDPPACDAVSLETPGMEERKQLPES